MRTNLLGLILVLTLLTASPAAAMEREPSAWSSIDLVEWVFSLLEVFELELAEQQNPPNEMGPAFDPHGQEGPVAEESEPGADPHGGAEPPTSEMGPAYEPNG